MAPLTPAEQEFSRARQDFLDALPIAAAVFRIAPDGRPLLKISNADFRKLTKLDAPAEAFAADLPFLRASGVAAALSAFVKTSEKVREFDADDGQQVGGRLFTVRIARMEAVGALGLRVFVTIVDRTAQVETEKSLRVEMLRDSLTGLPNRTAFNNQVETVLEDEAFEAGRHGLLVLDMTRFSRVNECVGAIAGDELLIAFARRLVSALRGEDLLARTGGDEFGVLMKLDRGLDDALQAAERIRSALSAPFRLSELEIRVDCAIGCALLNGQEQLAEEALRNAQFALKRSKASGRTEVYEPSQARAARRRFSIETELRRAIEADRLQLAFQPIIDLASNKVSGFEALARWEHEERGIVSPQEFIAVAEESGLIIPLGRWAIDAAARATAEWDRIAARKLPLRVGVNVSAIQIARDDVGSAVSSTLEANGLGGDRLIVELTESAIVQDPTRAAKVLDALKGLDARIAMDDFGTGYTSLAYLQRLPIDILKIDRSFVTGMLHDRDSVAIVRAILSLASALGMDTTAEGVESEELARTLTYLGCTHGQGFFFSKPLTAQGALDYWLAFA